MKLDETERVLARVLPSIHHVNDNTMVRVKLNSIMRLERIFCLLLIMIFLCYLQVIAYLRGPLLFVFNFHPTDSYEGYGIGVEEAGEYQVSFIKQL